MPPIRPIQNELARVHVALIGAASGFGFCASDPSADVAVGPEPRSSSSSRLSMSSPDAVFGFPVASLPDFESANRSNGHDWPATTVL